MSVTSQQLHEIALIRGLSAEIVTAIAERAETIELHAGETLFRQGDPADAFYLIEDGQLHIIRHYDNGEEFVLATLAPYETVGEMSALGREVRAVTATAVSDCVVVEIPMNDFFELMEHYHEMALHVLTVVGRHLNKMNLDVHEYAIGNASAPTRFANLLLLMADNHTGVVSENLQKHQMSRSIGVDVAWIDNILNEWVKAGYVVLQGRRLILENVAALQEIGGAS